GHVPQRMDHVLWMIENHPEWDGFILNLSQPKSADERHEADRVRAAWLRQAGPDQRSGAALHNAATYFEQRDPDFAVELMERAIRLEHGAPFHVEGIGALYARSQFGSGRNSPFAIRAKSILLSSTDWRVVAGALNEIEPLAHWGMGGDLPKL